MFPQKFETPESTSGSKRKRTPLAPKNERPDNSSLSSNSTVCSPISSSNILGTADLPTFSSQSLGSFAPTPFSNLRSKGFSFSTIRSSGSPIDLSQFSSLLDEEVLIPGLNDKWLLSAEKTDRSSHSNSSKRARISSTILAKDISLESQSLSDSSLYLSSPLEAAISTPTSTRSLFQYIGDWSVDSQGTFADLSPIGYAHSSSNSTVSGISDTQSIDPLDQALLYINPTSPDASLSSASTPGAPARPTNHFDEVINLEDVVSVNLFS